MEPNIKFQDFPHVGEKIFTALDLPTLLNCSLVCKDWKKLLNNPTFWLKKLRGVGQPLEIQTAWLSLIRKSSEIGVENQIFAKCLRMKYQDFVEQEYRDQIGPEHFEGPTLLQPKYWMKFPPLHTSCVYGQLEIVKLIYDFEEDFNRPMYFDKDAEKLDQNGSGYYPSSYYPYHPPNYMMLDLAWFLCEMPIFVAIRHGHTEVAKFLADTPKELEEPSINQFGQSTLHWAILSKNLELVKYLIPRTGDMKRLRAKAPNTHRNLIHAAIGRDLKIFQYLMALQEISLFVDKSVWVVALVRICQEDFWSKSLVPEEDIIEMVKIIAPLVDKNLPRHTGKLMSMAIEYGKIEILKILVKYFDVNVKLDVRLANGLLPIDFAVLENQAEAVKILSSHTNNLRVHQKFKKNFKMNPALNMLKLLIKKRNQPTEDQKNGVE